MGVLRIAMFGGRVPRLAPRLLPDTAAQQAMNTRLSSGELRPWWQPKRLATLSQRSPKSVYRYEHNGEKRTSLDVIADSVGIIPRAQQTQPQSSGFNAAQNVAQGLGGQFVNEDPWASANTSSPPF